MLQTLKEKVTFPPLSGVVDEVSFYDPDFDVMSYVSFVWFEFAVVVEILEVW